LPIASSPGQALHLGRHDSEALAGFSGARRLDRGIQRKQPGLAGDGADQGDDLADVAAGLRKLPNGVSGLFGLSRGLTRDGGDTVDLRHDFAARGLHLSRRARDRLHGLRGGADRLADAVRHVARLLRKAAKLVRPLREPPCLCRDLPCRHLHLAVQHFCHAKHLVPHPGGLASLDVGRDREIHVQKRRPQHGRRILDQRLLRAVPRGQDREQALDGHAVAGGIPPGVQACPLMRAADSDGPPEVGRVEPPPEQAVPVRGLRLLELPDALGVPEHGGQVWTLANMGIELVSYAGQRSLHGRMHRLQAAARGTVDPQEAEASFRIMRIKGSLLGCRAVERHARVSRGVPADSYTGKSQRCANGTARPASRLQDS